MDIRNEGEARRKNIEPPLSCKSLIDEDRNVLEAEDHGEVIRVLPEVNVIKIGGQSIIDRGRSVVYPVLDEIVSNMEQHQMLLCVGGGTRARHAYEVAMDLELPTGVIAAIGQPTPRQNARILQMLLAKHGGIYLLPEDFEKLPVYFKLNCIPIMSGMPPYEYWEKPPKSGRIPPNRTDSGTYLTAEFLGARSLIYIKDEDGLYTADPKKNPKADLITKISVQELIKMDLDDLILERVVLENMLNARHARSLQIINGLKPGNLTKALNGEQVGTIIYTADP